MKAAGALAIQGMCKRAYSHEENYIEINRWTMNREELMSALASLLCLGRAIDEAGNSHRERKCLKMKS